MDDRDVAWIQQSTWLRHGGISDLTASRISVDVAAGPAHLGDIVADYASLSHDAPDLWLFFENVTLRSVRRAFIPLSRK